MIRTCRLPWILLALSVAVATPALADTYLPYSQGGIPPGSDLFTWCDTPPCDVSQPVVCDTPEGSASLRVRTNVWGGWGVFLPQEEDLSAYADGDLRFFVKAPNASIGPFNVKVEFRCNPDPVNIPGGVTYTTSIADHGWDGTTAWQEIVIPLAGFFAPDPPDLQCLATVDAPFLSTIESLPFFNTFYIDYVRWQAANSHAGASSVQVQGRELLVDGDPFVVNGVAYAPISIGDNWTGAWRDRPDRYLIDFPLMAAGGVNTVRLYAPLLNTAMLDAAWANGLRVIPTFGVDQNQLVCDEGKDYMRDRFRETVLQWKDHPAILFWLVGNEVNINLGSADLCLDWYPLLDSLAQEAHDAEGASFHPVATANADTGGLADICQAGCSDDTSLPNVDLWAAQVYRGCGLDSTFSDYQAKSDCARPLVLTEFGVDAYDSMLEAENQTLQADCLTLMLEDADQALAVRTPGGVSSGQVVFEWLDEWWKAECDPGTAWTTHDTCASSNNPAYPDQAINEEWWGIASQTAADPDARSLRAANGILSNSWRLGAVCDLEVVSYDGGSGNLTISFDPADGSADHSLYYGPLDAVSSYTYTGSVSGLSATGTSTVALPPGSLYWLVAAQNSGTEGCYGKDSSNVKRPCFPDAESCAVPQATYQTCRCTGP